MELTGQRNGRAWTALVVFLLGVCLFAGLGVIGLVGPDEPRYASIARAMARTGNWLTPRLWGHTWFEKPILYYWSAATSFRLFGVNAWTARLPSALAALAGALLLGWAARRVYGRGTAMLALAIFPTTLGLFAFAHAATTDMLLAFSVEGAMLAALFALGGSDFARAGAAGLRRWPLLAVGAFIGLGTLAKGPVAIILAGGSVLLWAAVTRRWRKAIGFLRWESLAAFAAVALPWYVACAMANPDFASAFLWHQNFQRFLTPVFEHVQPWWYFFPVLALGLAPWTAVLLVAARDGWRVFRSGRAAKSAGVFVACWAVFPLLFFSFSESKLPGYILPAIPALVLLTARAVDGIGTRRDESAAGGGGLAKSRDRLGQWAIGLVGLTWIALAATAGNWLRRLPGTWDVAHQGVILAVLAGAAAVGVAVIALGATGRVRWAVGASALCMGVLVAAVAWVFLPQVDPYLSAREAAQAAEQVSGRSAAIEAYQLPRDWAYGLDYYLGRELPEWSPAERGPVWVYMTTKSLKTISGEGRAVGQTRTLRSGLVFVEVPGEGP